MSWRLPAFRAEPPERLEELAGSVGVPGAWRGLDRVPRFPAMLPLRTFGAVSAQLLAGEYEQLGEVRLLEWLDFLQPFRWVTLSPSAQIALAQGTWNAARRIRILEELLVLHLAVHAILGEPKSPRCLLESRPRDAWLSSDRLEVLFGLLEGELGQVSRTCLRLQEPPKALLRRLRFPQPGVELLGEIARECLSRFLESEVSSQNLDPWIIGVLDEGKHDLVEELILGLPVERVEKHEQLRDWVLQLYGPAVSRSLWPTLGAESQARLREWAGSIFFEDFRAIIESMLGERDRLGLEPWEVNQLQGRIWFWENYRSKFQRIRVLLPWATVSRLQSPPTLRTGEIEELGAGAQAEMCIFDLGDHLVVEVFRGAGELRLLPSTPETRRVLLEGSPPSLEDTRGLPPKRIHDHKYLWQSSLLLMLQEIGIQPDPDTQSFRVPKGRGTGEWATVPYSHETGGRPFSADKKRERWNDFKKWLPNYIATAGDEGLRLSDLARTTGYSEGQMREALQERWELHSIDPAGARWCYRKEPVNRPGRAARLVGRPPSPAKVADDRGVRPSAQEVLRALRAAGPEGCLYEDLMERGWSKAGCRSVMRELRIAGRVRGKQVATQTFWVLVQ